MNSGILLDTDSPHVVRQRDTLERDISIGRVSEVDGCLPASSYIRHRNLMYELAGDFTKK